MLFRDAYRAASAQTVGDNIWAQARGWAVALSLAFLAHCGGSADSEAPTGLRPERSFLFEGSFINVGRQLPAAPSGQRTRTAAMRSA
jgi:hypothetical protein